MQLTNPEQSRAAPGFFIDSSRDVTISETYISAGRGDAIVIQSGRGEQGRKVCTVFA